MNVAWLTKNTWLLVALVIPITALVGMIQGAAAAILVLVAAALIGVIALFWSSLRTLMGDTPLTGADAYAIAVPRAEEEQKQAVLRALKDLEFERSVGKISDEDYAQLVVQYRAEAKRLLRVIDEGNRPGRARVERLVHDRLVAAGLEAASMRDEPIEPPPSPEPEPKPRKKKRKTKIAEPARSVEIMAVTPEMATIEKASIESTWKSPAQPVSPVIRGVKLSTQAYEPPSKTCAECDTKNDPDANFCKKCGSKNFKGVGSSALTAEGPPAAKDNETTFRGDLDPNEPSGEPEA